MEHDALDVHLSPRRQSFIIPSALTNRKDSFENTIPRIISADSEHHPGARTCLLSIAEPSSKQSGQSSAHPNRIEWKPKSLRGTTGVTLASSTATMVQTHTRMPATTHSSSFLVALAGQERRVLELREELHQAEAHLVELKRQWTLREAKKPLELTHTIRVHGVNTLHFPAEDDGRDEMDMPSVAYEQERRRAIYEAQKPSQRKVMAGQRHTRALSLLSSERSNASKTPGRPSGPSAPETFAKRRSTETTSSLQTSVSLPANLFAASEKKGPVPKTPKSKQRPPSELMLRTGLQMAEGFREGLWTFLDDLRQVVVDEQVQPRCSSQAVAPPSASNGNLWPGSKRVTPPSKRQTPRKSEKRLQTPSKEHARDQALVLIGGMPQVKSATKGTLTAAMAQHAEKGLPLRSITQVTDDSIEDVEGWDGWDSPKPAEPIS